MKINLRGLQGTRKVAVGALICSVGGMPVRHISITQKCGCRGLKTASKVVYFSLSVFVLFDFAYVVFCLFVQANTVEHIFTCNVLHETSMGMYVYIYIYMVDVPRL